MSLLRIIFSAGLALKYYDIHPGVRSTVLPVQEQPLQLGTLVPVISLLLRFRSTLVVPVFYQCPGPSSSLVSHFNPSLSRPSTVHVHIILHYLGMTRPRSFTLAPAAQSRCSGTAILALVIWRLYPFIWHHSHTQATFYSFYLTGSVLPDASVFRTLLLG